MPAPTLRKYDSWDVAFDDKELTLVTSAESALPNILGINHNTSEDPDKSDEKLRDLIAKEGFVSIVVAQKVVDGDSSSTDNIKLRLLHHITNIDDKWYAIAEDNEIVEVPESAFWTHDAIEKIPWNQLINIHNNSEVDRLLDGSKLRPRKTGFIASNSTIIAPHMFKVLARDPHEAKAHIIALARQFAPAYTASLTGPNEDGIGENTDEIKSLYSLVMNNLIAQLSGTTEAYNSNTIRRVTDNARVLEIMGRICASYLYSNDEKHAIANKRKKRGDNVADNNKE